MPPQKEMERCVTFIASLTLDVIKPKTSVLLQIMDQRLASDLCTVRTCKNIANMPTPHTADLGWVPHKVLQSVQQSLAG